MNFNKVLEFIGSKWFMAGLGLLMIILLPTTYGNLMIVFEAGEMGRVWIVPVVFVCNILTAIMATYKATGMFFGKKREDKEEWED